MSLAHKDDYFETPKWIIDWIKKGNQIIYGFGFVCNR